MVRLGDKVKDTISKFTGIVVARTEWLTGCVRIGIEPLTLDKDGAPKPEYWFDEDRLAVLKTAAWPAATKSSGGPQRDPSESKFRP